MDLSAIGSKENLFMGTLEKKLAGALRKEMNIRLSILPEASGLRKIVRESLSDSKEGRGIIFESSYPWSLLPLLVWRAMSGDSEKCLPLATSLVFFKAAAEVFDDIEDADSPKSISARYGSAVAINAATALLMLAEKALVGLAAEGADNRKVARTIDLVNSYYLAACAGQHRELSRPSGRLISEREYLDMAAVKSAFAVECSCKAAAILADGDEKMIDMFAVFGRNLGMAAQMANDIQGIISGADITRGKMTLPVIYALKQTGGGLHEELEAGFLKKEGRAAPPADRIKDLLFQTGAVHYAAVKMEYYQQQAGKALDWVEAAGADIEQLRRFLE